MGSEGERLAALPPIVSSAPSCLFRAQEFFVAWQGVLTIAYSAFPPSLSQMKVEMQAAIPGIAKENPGSMWPKTTLACLKNDKRLTPSQLSILKQICSEESPALMQSDPVYVDHLSLVFYENCCLENIIYEAKIPLQRPLDTSEPLPDQKAYVRRVLDAFAPDNLEDYYFYATKDGNRSDHYRSSKAGVTLVHFLTKIPESLLRFRARVEESLPGLYDWFSEKSLHVTVRALL